MAGNSMAESEPWFTFFWNIRNFSYCCQKTNECIESPKMQLQKINPSWKLALFPRRELTEDIYLSIYGDCLDESESVNVKMELALLAEDDSVLKINPINKRTFEKESNWVRELLLRREEMLSFLSRDTLRIRCRLWRTDQKVANTTFFVKTVLSVIQINLHFMIGDFIGLEYGEKLDFLLWEESVDDKATLNIEVNKADEVVISFDSFCKSMKLFILQLYMTDTNGCKIDCGRHEIFPHEYRKNDICALSCTKNYLKRNEDMRLKSENISLILECSWSDGFDLNAIEKVYVGFSHVFYKICISNSDKEIADLKKAFENVCAEDNLNDVKFRSPTQTFHAHKVILSARSPVFRAMFTTDMKEKIEGCVDVPDLEDDTVHRMLQYVYSNNLEGLHWESAMKLYAAADKYQIVTLKNKCSSFVKRNLCPSNVCEVLCLADMHGDSELKRVAQEYALAQAEDVFSSDEWSEFAKNYPSLAMDAMLRNGNDQQQLE